RPGHRCPPSPQSRSDHPDRHLAHPQRTPRHRHRPGRSHPPGQTHPHPGNRPQDQQHPDPHHRGPGRPPPAGPTRHRTHHRRHHPDRLVPPRPHPLRSSLRQDGRHQPPTSLLRQHHQTPPQPHRRPTPQPRPTHHRHHPHPLLPHHPRLHPTTTSRRQNPQRNPTLPQALHHPTALPPPHHHTPKPHLTHIEASRSEERAVTARLFRHDRYMSSLPESIGQLARGLSHLFRLPSAAILLLATAAAGVAL